MRGVLNFHTDSELHLRTTLAALERREPIFLGNPRWSPEQRAAALRLVPLGCRVEGTSDPARGVAPCDWLTAWSGRLMIPTGGTGGTVRFIIHDERTLTAACESLRLGLEARNLRGPLHAAIVTPPWHVSGLMPALRARHTGGSWVLVPGNFSSENPLPEIHLPQDGHRLISLVPTQLQRLLAHPAGDAWLRQWSVILLGGTSVSAELCQTLQHNRLPIAITYGMTETAAAVALAWPEDLLVSGSPAGHLLPGVTMTSRAGKLEISTPSLGLGVWPAQPLTNPYLTGDLGELLPDGRVVVTGRADRVLITGGEKVDPARVERVLCGPGLAKSAWVTGLPDATWGQLIVATVVAAPELEATLRKVAEQALEPAARPRRYLFVEALPYDERGKLPLRPEQFSA